jgi:hypothetical protein
VSKPFTPLAGLLGVHLSQVSKAVHQDWHVHERPIFEWAVWHPAGHVKRYDVPHKVVVEGILTQRRMRSFTRPSSRRSRRRSFGRRSLSAATMMIGTESTDQHRSSPDPK